MAVQGGENSELSDLDATSAAEEDYQVLMALWDRKAMETREELKRIDSMQKVSF